VACRAVGQRISFEHSNAIAPKPFSPRAASGVFEWVLDRIGCSTP